MLPPRLQEYINQSVQPKENHPTAKFNCLGHRLAVTGSPLLHLTPLHTVIYSITMVISVAHCCLFNKNVENTPNFQVITMVIRYFSLNLLYDGFSTIHNDLGNN